MATTINKMLQHETFNTISDVIWARLNFGKYSIVVYIVQIWA